MAITKKHIKEELLRSQNDLDDCWTLLVELKTNRHDSPDFGKRFILFQERLGELIFRLFKIRERIIKEEKAFVQSKSSYKPDWFKNKMRSLSFYKKGIDITTNIAKSLGDAYAAFFYQFDLDLLNEHLTHQRIINSTAGVGELGELEFLRRVKHVEGDFTLFHGITNILRYGDFSFINLKDFRVTGIGELKTKIIDKNIIELEISIVQNSLSKNRTIKTVSKNNIISHNRKTERLKKQLNAIAGILKRNAQENVMQAMIPVNTYHSEINAMFRGSKVGEIYTNQVSPGLLFAGIKFPKSRLFNKLFQRDPTELIEKNSDKLVDKIVRLMKEGSRHNSIIIGQLLYSADFSEKLLPGSMPLFWSNIEMETLKRLYFMEYCVITILNPIHIIEEAEELGFIVESKYSKTKKISEITQNTIQNFDYFLHYITDLLYKESIITDSLGKAKSVMSPDKTLKVTIKPQQAITML